MKLTCARLAVAILCTATPSAAANIVLNPGFETGANDFNCTVTDWSLNIWCLGLLGLPPVSHDGIGAGGVNGPAEFIEDMWIAQTLSTVTAQAYELSFWVAMTSESSATHILVEWDGIEVEHFVNPISSPCLFDSETSTYTCDWIQLVVPALTAASASTQLRILASNDQGLLLLDDVSVVESAAAALPEPGSLLLLGAGLVGTAAGVRRRRQKRSV